MSNVKAEISDWPQKTLLQRRVVSACVALCVCVGVCVWADGADAQKSWFCKGDTTTGTISMSHRVAHRDWAALYCVSSTQLSYWDFNVLYLAALSLSGNVYSVCLKQSDSYRPCKAKRSGRSINTRTQPHVHTTHTHAPNERLSPSKVWWQLRQKADYVVD